MVAPLDPLQALTALGFAGLILGWLWIIRMGSEPGENKSAGSEGPVRRR